jgi:hypothetical protein
VTSRSEKARYSFAQGGNLHAWTRLHQQAQRVFAQSSHYQLLLATRANLSAPRARGFGKARALPMAVLRDENICELTNR